MNRRLALWLLVVSLMQFTSVCTGRSVKHDLYADLKRLAEEDALERLVNKQSESEFNNGKYSNEDIENGGEYNEEVELVDTHDNQPGYRGDRLAAGVNGLSSAQKNRVIEMHNRLRRGEGASNMQFLKYNNKLAQLAQDWTDRCVWGHRPQDSYSASDYGFSSVGENIWMLTGNVGKLIPEKPIQDWFDEKNGYVYSSNYCARPPCGHYTAIVWADTREVGCGLTRCSSLQNAGANDAFYFVCNYGPGGNTQDELPYKKGAPCSECSSGKFYCTQGLCDRTCKEAGSGDQCECKARCENGSPTPDCKCRCNSGYSGVGCNARCEDKNPQCGANPGWSVRMCTDKTIFGGMMIDQVNEQCPKMCGKCK